MIQLIVSVLCVLQVRSAVEVVELIANATALAQPLELYVPPGIGVHSPSLAPSTSPALSIV